MIEVSYEVKWVDAGLRQQTRRFDFVREAREYAARTHARTGRVVDVFKVETRREQIAEVK